MTKIAIQPNASGSGTFTLTAPDSNDNRTFTLPDATGEVYTSGNILGAVSESGGIPTGAIIQRGSNANGEFVRYADGTMICFMQRITPLDQLVFSFTYPAAFIGTAQGTLASWGSLVFAQRDVVISHYTRVLGGSTGSTTGEIIFQNNAPGLASVDVFLVATGRWF